MGHKSILSENHLRTKQEQFENLNLDFSESAVIDSMLSEDIISKKRYNDIISHIKDNPKQQYDKYDLDNIYTKKEKAGIKKIKTDRNISKISIDHIKLARFRLLNTILKLVILTLVTILTTFALIEKVNQSYIIISIIFLLYVYVISKIIRKANNLSRAKNETDPSKTKKNVKDILMNS